MRKVIAAAFVSLDGVMQGPGGPDEDRSGGFEHGGWVAGYWDDEVGAALDETFSTPFDLLLGRRTYDIFAAHWPRVAADPELVSGSEGDAEMARLFDRVTKYVATHAPDTLTWRNSQPLGNDVAGEVRELKQGTGPNLLTQGSSELLQTLMANDLVDEFRLCIFPLVLGKGKRLFGEGASPGGFKVTKSATTPGGVLLANYERDGALKTGSFALEDTSGDERE